jgi:hypothetical protein
MNWEVLLKLLPSLLSLFGGAGPWSLVAMGVAALGAAAGVAYLIKKNNDRIDNVERENAGADAGNTSVDLRQQSEANGEWEKDEWEKFQSEKPVKGEGND